MISRLVTFLHAVVLCTFVLLVSNCGKAPQADEQQVVGVNASRPAFDMTQMALNENLFSAVFSGSTIVWHNDPDVSKVAAISQTSSALMDNGVAQLNYVDQKIAPQIALFKRKYAEVETLYKEVTARSYQSAVTAAATWFAGADGTGGQLKTIAQQLGAQHQVALAASDFQQAGQNFALYCQAKLWERAVHKRLITALYRGLRPTPSAMCEGIYQKLGLLNRDSAACAATSTYKSYFACLWHEGVEKTPLWSMRYPPGSTTRVTFDSLTDAELIRLFREHNAGAALLAQDNVLNIEDFSERGTLVLDLNFAPGPHLPVFASIKKIIGNVELVADPDDKFQFIPVGDRTGAAADFIGEANRDLRTQLKQFNLLAAHNYVNENKFNIPFQQPQTDLADMRWSAVEQQRFVERFPSIAISSDPQVAPLTQQLLAKKQSLGETGAIIRQLSGELDPAKSCTGKQTLGCRYAALVKTAQAAVKGEDVSLAVWQSEVAISEDRSANILTARVKLQKAAQQVYWACTPMVKTARCPRMPDERAITLAAIKFDKELGGLTIRLPVSNLAASGLSEAPRSDFSKSLSFNALPANELAESTIVLKGYLGVVSDKLRVLIGDVQINNRSDETLYNGAIKYRDELPPQLKLINDFKALAASLQ